MSGSFERTRHAKDAEIEGALQLINERLAGLFPGGGPPARPVLLLVGHQRSGSTLLGQYLTAALEVGYPSNLIARFWRAPIAGLVLQQAVASAIDAQPGFSSELGTTTGLLGPHEFSYFWNHWFPDQRRCLDAAAFVATIGGLEAAFARPLLFKNNFNALRIDVLATLLPTARFVRIRRDLVDVACSTLDARRLRFGTDRAWFGVQAPGWEDLAALSPIRQIAAQIRRTEAAMDAGWAQLPADSGMLVDYEEVCRAPASVARAITRRWDVVARDGTNLPASFASRHPARAHSDAEALRAALADQFAGEP